MKVEEKTTDAAELTLHVLEKTSFFTIDRNARVANTVNIAYQGDDFVILRINGCVYRIKNGVIHVPTSIFATGNNVCEICVGDKLIPCEGLIMRGGYVLPAGITDKAYVLDLHERCTALAHACEELENELEKRNKQEAFTDDIFDIG